MTLTNLRERYRSILGKETDDFLRCSEKPSTIKSIRVNTLKISDTKLLDRLASKGAIFKKIPFLVNGYYVKSKFSLGSTPEYLQGYYFLQEAASQIPTLILDPKEGEHVLDMAASPGAKTTQIAQLMKNKGLITAIDIKGRTDALINNLERLSVSNTSVYESDARNVSSLNMRFDKILLDAPCSGNICSQHNWIQKRRVKDFINRSEVQKELIKSAYNVLKDDGILVYSTCSLEPEEDEFVVQHALDLGFKLKNIDKEKLGIGNPGLTEVFNEKLNPELEKCLRLWPHKSKTQGFFVAKLRKE